MTLHGQTAGAADWVIDGGFSDYANSMRQQGYTVKQIDGESNITPNTLRGINILVLPEANIPFKRENNKLCLILLKKVAISSLSLIIIMQTET